MQRRMSSLPHGKRCTPQGKEDFSVQQREKRSRGETRKGYGGERECVAGRFWSL